jgi:hypothetical protein
MSGKLKLYCALGLAIVASITAVFIVSHRRLEPISVAPNPPPPPLATTIPSSVMESVPERTNYQTIPLEIIASNLRGTDPGEVALNAFGKISTSTGSRQVEVAYPQLNQAIVTITQMSVGNSTSGIRYRVEMSPFGRSILVGVGSPRVWQVVWAGSQVKCIGKGKPDWSQACR